MKYTSRKFIVGLLSLLIITCLLIGGKIDQNIFSNLFMFVSGTYFVSNITAKKIDPKD